MSPLWDESVQERMFRGWNEGHAFENPYITEEFFNGRYGDWIYDEDDDGGLYGVEWWEEDWLSDDA